MSEQNVQAARGLYEAFNRGDLDAFERGLSSDILWNEADNSLYSKGNPYRSFSAIRDQVFAPTLTDFDAFKVDLEQLIDGGDFVIGTGRYRGRNKGTGRDLSAQFCHLLHFDTSARLDRVQEYTDTLQEAEVSGRAQVAEQIQILQPAE
ncbi:nuclear transport factor 2 family protein [Sphingomonas hankyongi]|uniref:Nuclear transport factor 2 family protein n=1 Tax=Sphingomonas hankyongi TaxID=2908209 RepID=A0ABT0S5F0_9SPHN|nr:nuclear transport factor 2 family protein [Sphingomonas hankyongi]MCL6730976.1 nuclear transport factor 2 family protein [Sphingomonas hankyongi]